ncbi:MAG TPA: anti-sigma factor [Candidatus Limnocylindria bacterium]
MTCERLDELAASYALGAVPPDEERAMSEHLATCDQPHADARELIGAAGLLPAALPPMEPSPALRARLMATVAATPQDHRRRAPVNAPVRAEPRRPWWQLRPLPMALAAVGLAAAVGLGAWNLDLNRQLAERDEALRAVASADAAYAVAGSAGSGWVLETDGQAIFLADALAALPADQLYALWLIGPEGEPVAVGTLTDTEGVAFATLERELGSATTFAVTVESGRVDAPTSDPVLVASLEG